MLCKNPSYGRWGGPPQGGGNKATAATDLANAARGSVNLSRVVQTPAPSLGLAGQKRRLRAGEKAPE